MLNRLQTKLTILILGGTIFSIILVSIILNTTIFQRFDRYMEHEQAHRMQDVIDLVEQYYLLNNGWTDETFKMISLSQQVQNFDIVIKDLNGELIYSQGINHSMITMHQEMMKNMNYSLMGKSHSEMMSGNSGEYIVSKYELKSNGGQIGSIEIGSLGPFMITERDIEFTKGINKSIIFAAIISIIISILLGLYASRAFSRPIVEITKAANRIREGKLNLTLEIKDPVTELQDLALSINHLSKSLNEQQQLRKRLTSDISHELRTPLTILQSHIEAINDGIWEPTPEKLGVCKNEVIHLIKLVDQLKHLTDIENHEIVLDIQSYNLTELIREVAKGFEYEIQKKEISIVTQLEKSIIVMGDQDKIRQVLINVLSNAVKYTNPQGRIVITLSSGDAHVIVGIADTGIGIHEQDIPYVFERFYRSDQSRSRKTGGAGIGLTITKNLVEAHGGTISVTSQLNCGSLFEIILPKDYQEKNPS